MIIRILKNKFLYSFSGKLWLSVGSILVVGNVGLVLILTRLYPGLFEQSKVFVYYLLGFWIIFTLSLCTSLLLFVKKPLNDLLKGINTVAAGDLDYEIPVDSHDEMGDMAASFNAMTHQLSRAKKELMEWGETLEKKVEEKTEAIQRAQDQLVHSEKLASLGRMAAGVAHELNSPLTGVVTFAHLMRERFPEGSQDREDLDVIIEQTNRCTQIIRGLLGFARASSEEKNRADLNEVVQSSLNLVRNKADFLNVEKKLELDSDLPLVMTNVAQIQQVFLNMIVNAGDAMDGKGTLTVATRRVEADGRVFAEVEFRDSGPGISPDNMEKLFEPFFTTKPVGKGTGLGLAVSHGIVKDHGGHIRVWSKPGEGTSFFISFPVEGGAD